MPYEPTPEAAARMREQLPERITDTFLARTGVYAHTLDSARDEVKLAVDQAAERMLGKIMSALCNDTGATADHYHADLMMNHCSDHPDWTLLKTRSVIVDALMTKALTEKLKLEDKPISLEAQTLGYWGTDRAVLGCGMIRVVLRRIA